MAPQADTKIPKEDREIGRVIGKSIWMSEFKSDNAAATVEERSEDWKKNKSHYVKLGTQVHRMLSRKGYVVSSTE